MAHLRQERPRAAGELCVILQQQQAEAGAGAVDHHAEAHRRRSLAALLPATINAWLSTSAPLLPQTLILAVKHLKLLHEE
jgi:hypothetical protein